MRGVDFSRILIFAVPLKLLLMCAGLAGRFRAMTLPGDQYAVTGTLGEYLNRGNQIASSSQMMLTHVQIQILQIK